MKKILFILVFIPIVSFSQGKFFGGDGSGYASASIELETLSVPIIPQGKVIIYPNPVVSNIHLNEQITEPTIIIDATGKTVLKLKTNQSIIDVSKLSQGVYFLKYKNKTYRFIKK